MKKKLIIGSLLAVSILMMFPSISALEYDAVEDAVEKANEEYLLKLLEDKNIDPRRKGIIGKIFCLILKIITFPIRIIMKFLKCIFRIFTLPFRIFWFILEILTPFRDLKTPFCCLKKHHHCH